MSFCSAALFNRNWVITAAHCVDRNEWLVDDLVCFVGLSPNNNTYYGENEILVQVKRVVLHPSWPSPPPELPMLSPIPDVVLLELETPIPGFQDAILVSQTPPEGTTLVAAGFGTAVKPGQTLPAGMTGWLRGWESPISHEETGSLQGELNTDFYFFTRFRNDGSGGVTTLNAFSQPGDSGSPVWFWDQTVGNYALVDTLSGGAPTSSSELGRTFITDLTAPSVRNWILATVASTPPVPTPPELAIQQNGADIELLLPAALPENEANKWRVEASADLQQWSGAAAFINKICRLPMQEEGRYYRAFYLDNPNPPVTIANEGSLGAAVNGTGYYIQHGAPGAIGGESQNRAMRTTIANLGGNVQMPYHAAHNPDGPFSVEVWTKPGQTSRNTRLIDSYAPDSNTGEFGGWQLDQRPDAGTAQTNGNGFRFGIYDMQSDNSQIDAFVQMSVSTTKWYHVAGVYDGSKIELYVNGSKVVTTEMSGRRFRPNNWAGVMIGHRTRWYLGDLDEPAIYGYALTAAQVQAHYQAGIDPARVQPYRQTILADQPLGYWPFD